MLPPNSIGVPLPPALTERTTQSLCDRVQVVKLSQRTNNGRWFASLDTQRAELAHWTFRECSSCEQGVAGSDLWVTRHRVRLRAEIDRLRVERRAPRP